MMTAQYMLMAACLVQLLIITTDADLTRQKCADCIKDHLGDFASAVMTPLSGYNGNSDWCSVHMKITPKESVCNCEKFKTTVAEGTRDICYFAVHYHWDSASRAAVFGFDGDSGLKKTSVKTKIADCIKDHLGDFASAVMTPLSGYNQQSDWCSVHMKITPKHSVCNCEKFKESVTEADRDICYFAVHYHWDSGSRDAVFGHTFAGNGKEVKTSVKCTSSSNRGDKKSPKRGSDFTHEPGGAKAAAKIYLESKNPAPVTKGRAVYADDSGVVAKTDWDWFMPPAQFPVGSLAPVLLALFLIVFAFIIICCVCMCGSAL
eukprot:CAMPEP_0202729878 /NCGR_PEP_ID=MMETSP1385-20130828/186358_1 /ASSEMBLY_ACC=CAM_ASM_000861 /TAXON_ID=933848 /ORGANISM="Elphidium margaritaceum" /LENGTH=317 /DNA_ID=CAMNT_0049396149 /DNA_START=85 /DNA_END=1036 /DNA_ORIENTATION=-